MVLGLLLLLGLVVVMLFLGLGLVVVVLLRQNVTLAKMAATREIYAPPTPEPVPQPDYAGIIREIGAALRDSISANFGTPNPISPTTRLEDVARVPWSMGDLGLDENLGVNSPADVHIPPTEWDVTLGDDPTNWPQEAGWFNEPALKMSGMSMGTGRGSGMVSGTEARPENYMRIVPGKTAPPPVGGVE